eukprot:CAMPEP_0178374426 /NCGR_PEP_ID=MMETSP0689_2-20121128/2371_1 /TAXON_ID=160604 /ORGANISM="Amphidinium massartii, Strain CS-259" /LENGTH=270 /DNA_ID=CAMNT_0019994397 /DNA_START=92 /DNA_END=900 /DNA_ORIENTATION=-
MNLRILMDPASDVELRRQALGQLERDAKGVELRGIARCSQLPEVLAFAMRDSAQRQSRSSLLSSVSRIVVKLSDDHLARGAFTKRLSETMVLSASPESSHTQPFHEALRRGWPLLPSDSKPALAMLVADSLRECGKVSSSAARVHALIFTAFLDPSMAEELQVAALQALHTLTNSSGREESFDVDILPQPKVANAAILRLIPKQPLLCLDVLAALSLQDRFRAFFGTQTSLLSFLAYCCHQPESAAASAAGTVEALPLQRSAARCIANLS